MLMDLLHVRNNRDGVRHVSVPGLMLMIVAAWVTGCSSPVTLPEVAQEANSSLEPFVLLPGDLLEVRFPRHADWNHETRIRADGLASFLACGERMASGSSPEALGQALSECYAQHLNNPAISVLVKELAERPVYVIGEVDDPGPVPVTGEQIPFLRALGLAGGPRKDTARLKTVLLVRHFRESDAVKSWIFDARHEYWGVGPALQLQPGDVVFIPNTIIDKVDIWVDQYIRRLVPLPTFSPLVGG